MDAGEMKLSDLPEDVCEEIGKLVSDYSVGIVKMRETAVDADAAVGGSGTCVRVGRQHAILTAGHVLEHFGMDEDVGLILATRFDPMCHRYVMKAQAVSRVLVAYEHKGAEGPDLGLFLLPEADVAELRARKSFYDLSLHARPILESPSALDDGAWFMCGFAEELIAETLPERGFDRVKIFRGPCCIGWAEGESSAAGFDYLDFVPAAGGGGLPMDYGGFSGAGLWQTLLERTREGIAKPTEIILSGVAFYQSPRTGGGQKLRCHGRRSVYVRTLDRLTAAPPNQPLQPTGKAGG